MTHRLVALVAVAALVAAACSSSSDDTAGDDSGTPEAPGATATPEPASAPTTEPDAPSADTEPMLDLVLVWHQHQPRYPVVDGVVSRPWVRVHAAKDYVDMAARLQAHPEVRATVNVTPSLLLQLEELATGAIDVYSQHTLVPAADLSTAQRSFIVDRFFDVNPLVIARFPRFQEIADRRASLGDAAASELSTAELLDLQVLFNLAWTDPEYLAEAPLAALVRQEQDFAETDKDVVLGVHDELVQQAIDIHAELAAGDQIEVSTTPFAHPILPLLIDTEVASVGDPTGVLPGEPFREFLDADQHVIRGLDEAQRLLGVRPAGMWPGEGAVSDDALRIFARNNVSWVATGEQVLARSVGLEAVSRDENDVVREAAELYQPRMVETPDGEVAVFFRDNRLSDLIGFEYSQTPAAEAVDDFIGRLRAGRDAAIAGGNDAPAISVILDGENAWEHYPNDGIDFLDELYARLASTPWIRTITPSEYLDEKGDGLDRLDAIHPGAWFSPNYATWIGEAQEARAWELLRRTRLDLRGAERRGEVDATALAAATEAMLFAEGSDWFWWYGTDQDSGDDGFFDRAYRELLGSVYDLIGEPRPASLDVPLVPAPAIAPDNTPADFVTLVLDGTVDPEVSLGSFAVDGQELRYAWAQDALQLVLPTAAPVDLYLGGGRPVVARGTTLDGRVLGFDAGAIVRWDGSAACVVDRLPAVGRNDVDVDCEPLASTAGDVVEIAVPLASLGALSAGDELRIRLDDDELAPVSAVGLRVPDVGGFDVVRTVSDVADDANGPGTYTPPTDVVFAPGAFDLTEFVLGETEEELVLQFAIAAPVTNPWGSPNGLALQTFDVYFDIDSDATTGTTELLPGRDATLSSAAWDVAVTIEGWQPAVVTPGADGAFVESTPVIAIAVLPDDGRVTVRVPKNALPELSLADASIGVALLSQEGFPSAGVRRVRDVAEVAGQWVLGGAPADGGHTRIVDWLHPEPGVQQTQLAAPATLELLSP